MSLEKDKIIESHQPEVLERIFDSTYLAQTPLYSVMAQATKVPWLQIIPKQPLDDPEYIGQLYAEIQRLANHLQSKGYGHSNIAKIGNKLPYAHIHLVFRQENDEAWPDAIWCHEPLKADAQQPQKLKKDLSDFFEC